MEEKKGKFEGKTTPELVDMLVTEKDYAKGQKIQAEIDTREMHPISPHVPRAKAE